MSKPHHIYLDNNASTRLDERVLEEMLPYFTENYANSGSPHLAGLAVKEAVEKAAWQTADLIGANEEEIIFTSGATEAINLALKGLQYEDKKHIVTTETEHKAVLDTCQYLQKMGCKVDFLPVGSQGSLDLHLLNEAITDKTLIVCIMMINNETGVMHDIAKIASIVHAKNAILMCDATQAVGKIPIDVTALGIDIMPLSAHKFHGPKGVGALYLSAKAKTKLSAQIHGGGQQRKLRSGTLNTTGIIGLGKAAAIAKNELESNKAKVEKLRDQLEKGLLQFEGSLVNGDTQNRIFNISNICFPGVNSESLILALQHISVSNGSSCTAVTSEPSHVLKALGLSNEEAFSSIRFSLSKYNTSEEIEETITTVLALAEKLRN